jgi:hypothetical protein
MSMIFPERGGAGRVPGNPAEGRGRTVKMLNEAAAIAMGVGLGVYLIGLQWPDDGRGVAWLVVGAVHGGLAGLARVMGLLREAGAGPRVVGVLFTPVPVAFASLAFEPLREQLGLYGAAWLAAVVIGHAWSAGIRGR